MNPPPEHLDARIDSVLNALRDTEPSADLAQRIAAGVAQRAEARSAGKRVVMLSGLHRAQSRDTGVSLAPPALYTLAAASLILLLALSFFAVHTHHATPSRNVASVTGIHSLPSASLSSAQKLDTGMQSTNPRRSNVSDTTASHTSTSHTSTLHTSSRFEGAGLQSRHKPATENAALAAEGDPSSSTERGFQAATLTATTPADDPDAIALAETLAPSHPAPPTPLTPQERLLLSAARKGSPILLAELEPTRELALRDAAEGREKAGLQQFARNLLAPLALSEALDSTTRDDAQPMPSLNLNEPPTNGASQ